MDIIFLDETTSTSLEAAAELRQGRKPPFAVIAGAQTGGRGRRGRSWSSPAGGIYLTVVVPPPEVTGALLGNIPLWTGVQTARWLRQRLNFHVALKWPNDLMFDGRKLGGILVESGIEGSRQGPVIIGIGINCVQAPDVEDSARETSGAPSVSLADICTEVPDPRTLAQSLAAHLEQAWLSVDFKSVGAEFLTWSPPAARLFSDRVSGRFWLAESVEADGSLVLAAVGNPPEKQRLNSVDHQLVPASRLHPAPVFLADVGNTASKIKVYASCWSEKIYGESRVAHDAKRGSDLFTELERLAQLAPARGWPFYIAGVSPVRIAALAAAAETAGFLPLIMEKRPVLRHGAFYALNELGIDRLAAIEGWLATRRKSSAHVAVIASFGTAQTVDAVRADGCHLGGVIAPGLALASKVLNENTGLLPLVDRAAIQSSGVIGSSTQSAIAAGIAGQAAGLIERIVREQRNEAGPQDKILTILTGGDADAAAMFVPAALREPDLVFLGLKAMIGGGLLQDD